MKKLSELIKEKKFDYVNSSITDELFPVPSHVAQEGFKLCHFNRYMSSEDAIGEMGKEGYRPANIHELLTWGEWNEKDWVVALGSVGEVLGHRHVPFLLRVGSERNLLLDWFDGGWAAHCRFLAVRNLESGKSGLDSPETLTLGRAIEMVKAEGYVIYKSI